jgi:hypothetical protein
MFVLNENEHYDNIIHFEHEQNIFTITGQDLRVILSCSLEWDKKRHKIKLSCACTMNELWLTGRNLGQVCNSKLEHAFV